MKFQQYLTEINISKSTPNKWEKIKELIHKDCTPYLREWKRAGRQPMWRASSGKNKYFFQGSVRKDRNPRDMPETLHGFFDDFLKDKFGFRGRTNAIFCTGKEGETIPYGEPYIIFPIGEYKIVWSPVVRDLWHHLTIVARREIKTMGMEPKDVLMDVGKTYKAGNLKAALSSGSEIMVNCKKFYGIGPETIVMMTNSGMSIKRMMEDI